MDGDRVVLLRPRFVRGPLAWWIQPALKRPHLRVHLDEVGSFIWQLSDGTLSVGQIADALEERFGDSVAPALKRLRLFLRQMEGGRLIRLRWPEPEASNTPRAEENP
jgi:hypothetical protein